MTFWPLLLLVSTCDPAPALEGKQLFEAGKFAQAEQRFRDALDQPCDPPQQIANRINLAASLRERHATAEAAKTLPAASVVSAMAVEIQITYWNCLALIEEQAGGLAQAEAAFRRAIALLTPETPPRLSAQVWTNFARYQMRQGRLREAGHSLRHPGWLHDRLWSLDLNWAELRRMQGRPREAEATLRALRRDGRPMPVQIRGAIANNLASLAAGRGQRREAEQLWREAQAAFREAYGASHPVLAKSLSNLAAHYTRVNKHAEAEALYREALTMDPEPMMLNNLGVLLHQRGRVPEAEAAYRQALAIYAGKAAPVRQALHLHGNLGVLLAATGRAHEALAAFENVVRLLPLAIPADDASTARYLEQYESLLRRKHESAEAERVAMLAMRYRVRSALRTGD
jgi:tetratricopeptide (TPR) repeat protein